MPYHRQLRTAARRAAARTRRRARHFALGVEGFLSAAKWCAPLLRASQRGESGARKNPRSFDPRPDSGGAIFFQAEKSRSKRQLSLFSGQPERRLAGQPQQTSWRSQELSRLHVACESSGCRSRIGVAHRAARRCRHRYTDHCRPGAVAPALCHCPRCVPHRCVGT